MNVEILRQASKAFWQMFPDALRVEITTRVASEDGGALIIQTFVVIVKGQDGHSLAEGMGGTLESAMASAMARGTIPSHTPTITGVITGWPEGPKVPACPRFPRPSLN
jgi:hypothetical protein